MTRFLSIITVLLALVLTPARTRADDTGVAAPESPAATSAAAPSGPGTAATPVPATLANVVKALARLDAFNLDDDHVIDDYARAVHCDLYQRYHDDEFTWREVRAAMRDSIKLQSPTFPTNFYLFRSQLFGSYDFTTGTLPFVGGSALHHAIYLQLYAQEDKDNVCDKGKLETLPLTYVAVLDTPLQLDGIPLSETDAAELVKALETRNNGSRVVYARFTIDLEQVLNDGHKSERRMDISAHLDNIELFLDAAFQQRFWSGLRTAVAATAVPAIPDSLNDIPFKGVSDPNAVSSQPPPSLPLPDVPKPTAPAGDVPR